MSASKTPRKKADRAKKGPKPPADLSPVDLAEEMLTAGLPPATVPPKLAALYGVHLRSAQRWCEQVRERWAEIAAESRPIRKAQMRAYYLRTFQEAIRLEQLTAAVASLAQLAKLDGLNESEHVHHHDHGAAELDLSQLTDAELEAYEQLAAKAERKALPAADGAG